METKKFERVVISFDEFAFAQQEERILKYCELANEAIDGIKSAYDLLLNESEIKEMFLNLNANPNGLIENHFSSQKSRLLREESINDLNDFINELLFDFKQFDGTTRKAIYVKRGRLLVDPVELQKLKQSFEESLETPRAVELYNRHLELFEKYCELSELTNNNPAVRNLWSENLNKNKFEIKKLNYNNL